MNKRSRIDTIMEYFGNKNIYELVKDYCVAFDLPVNNVSPTRVNMGDRLRYGKELVFHVIQYAQASESEQHTQILHLIYTMYTMFQIYVEIGHSPFNDSRLRDMGKYGRQMATADYEGGYGPPPADRLMMGMPYVWRIESLDDAIEHVFSFMNASTWDEQVWALRNLLDWVLVTLARVGVASPESYVYIVHESKMSSLWADGKPRYNTDGGLRKPEGYTTPHDEFRSLFIDQLLAQEQEDEIPF